MKIRFTVHDCADGSHFGYAYFEAGCAPMEINQAFCTGTTSATLVAPNGFSYSWTGPGITVPITTQQINIPNPTSGAVYSCVCTSVTGILLL